MNTWQILWTGATLRIIWPSTETVASEQCTVLVWCLDEWTPGFDSPYQAHTNRAVAELANLLARPGSLKEGAFAQGRVEGSLNKSWLRAKAAKIPWGGPPRRPYVYSSFAKPPKLFADAEMRR